jgi:thiosulfate/3-mercaptopyruvate sulfurtransferase
MKHLPRAALAALALAATAAAQQPAAYPRPELLVEPAALAKLGADAKHRILDARAKKQYDAGHVPGAVWVDHEKWAKTFKDNQDPKMWSELIGKLGIDPQAQVVVYDEAKGKEAARVWWILRYWGHERASLLNGGWAAYQAGGHPVSKEAATAQAKPYDIAAARKAAHAGKADVLEAVKDKKLQIIDTRSEGEHCGTTVLGKRGGAIPGSLHLEWSDALDKKTGRFKPASELRQLFKDAGIDLDRPSVTYCQSGGRASVMVFTMELMGAKDVRNYYRSWAEWSGDPDTPVVTPKKK